MHSTNYRDAFIEVADDDGAGRVAIFPRGSEAYERLRNDSGLQQLKAMRSAKAR